MTINDLVTALSAIGPPVKDNPLLVPSGVSISGYSGVSGVYTFNRTGETPSQVAIVTARSVSFLPYSPYVFPVGVQFLQYTPATFNARLMTLQAVWGGATIYLNGGYWAPYPITGVTQHVGFPIPLTCAVLDIEQTGLRVKSPYPMVDP